MEDLIKREDAISRAWIKNTCKEKIAHYKMRKNRIMAQKSISYDPKPQIEGFDDEIAIYEWILREVDNVPSAEPKQGEWIPCSERLPKESGDYLVTYEWVEAIGTRYTEVEIVPFVHNRWEFFIDPEEVLAWMPLPEPWKGADDE